ncbi:MAG: formylglycine-generating enzyme family protein [Pseudomonadota bacterium]
MRRLRGGRFLMGSDVHYPEEAPSRWAEAPPFWIDATPVTNTQFARFVAETGHVTSAEIAPTRQQYPDADPANLVAGSTLFSPPTGPVDLSDPGQWWTYAPGVTWRTPQDDGLGWRDLPHHPVVHVSYADAQAYAAWVGKRLPTEAEWEFAARGDLTHAAFAWGDTLEPRGRPLANVWQGAFPHENLLRDGFARTSPVRSFPANGHGLFDMIGNVWEWTVSPFDAAPGPTPCCGGGAARGPTVLTLKGGSHLCAPNYCQRYRPAARHAQTPDTSTSHIGFRCVADW